MRTILGLAIAMGVGCGGDGDAAPICEVVVSHYYAAGCTFGSLTEAQMRSNCEQLMIAAADGCEDEHADVRACWNTVVADRECDCDAAEEALTSCIAQTAAR